MREFQGPVDFFAEFAAVLKGLGKISPKALHPLEKMAGAREYLLIFFDKLLVKASENFNLVVEAIAAVLNNCRQKRIDDSSATDHPGGGISKAIREASETAQIRDISVIHNSMMRHFEAACKCLQVRFSLVHLYTGSGMNNNVLQWISIENRNEPE